MSTAKKGSTSKAAFLASVPDPETTGPIVAAPGTDWSQQLIKLAKTAELKKHTLALQIHTADIVNAQASLEEKTKALADVKTEKNWLESERERLLIALREINVDRERVDLAEANLSRSIQEFEQTIGQVRDGDYANARATVDTLRAELDLPPLPSLQETLDEKAAFILEEKRKGGFNANHPGTSAPKKRGRPPKKRDDAGQGGADLTFEVSTGLQLQSALDANGEPMAKRARGRPRGSKTKGSVGGEGEGP